MMPQIQKRYRTVSGRSQNSTAGKCLQNTAVVSSASALYDETRSLSEGVLHDLIEAARARGRDVRGLTGDEKRQQMEKAETALADVQTFKEAQVVFLGKAKNGGREDPAYQAVAEFGAVMKTIFQRALPKGHLLNRKILEILARIPSQSL